MVIPFSTEEPFPIDAGSQITRHLTGSVKVNIPVDNRASKYFMHKSFYPSNIFYTTCLNLLIALLVYK